MFISKDYFFYRMPLICQCVNTKQKNFKTVVTKKTTFSLLSYAEIFIHCLKKYKCIVHKHGTFKFDKTPKVKIHTIYMMKQPLVSNMKLSANIKSFGKYMVIKQLQCENENMWFNKKANLTSISI